MIFKTISLLIILALTTACSSVIYEDSKDLQTNKILDIEPKKNRPLCKYKEVKGISEITSIEDGRYVFIFFPGDSKFIRVKKQLIQEFTTKEIDQLHVGQEVRSIKHALVSGHSQCLQVEINLIPSLPLPH